ncbi:MAG: GTPase ObgE [Planctomycetota bacterium]|nr:GTPase ObgE [Planctomycetota bacterium]
MFIDEREVIVRSGKGGDGIVAFRREKRVPRGGPAGGDGGDGGSVLFVADVQLTTFGDMEESRHIRAQNGEPGGGNKMHGKNGADRILKVPVGTTVYSVERGHKIIDLTEDGQTWVAAGGGRGGKGNARFASATDQAPRRATLGKAGHERRLRLELRLLADVGLIGLPNAGKSTLLSRITEARPKIADYPFTTLEPYLGIVELPDGPRFVVADLPGLIEGAHSGHGLGDRFLRHVERTRVLLHLVDPFPAEGAPGPLEAYQTIRRELEAYGHGLAERPEILAATKADLTIDAEETREVLSRLAELADRRVYPISAVSGQGLDVLLRAVGRALARAQAAPEVPDRLADGVRSDGGEDTPPVEDASDAR